MEKIKGAPDGLLRGIEFDMGASGDCSGEIVMPDYYPEIRKVVSVSARALPDSKFVSDKNLEYGGTVSFNVLYIGDDGALSCVSASPEYSFTQTLPAEVPGASVWIDTCAETPQCRVLAPRKLSLRARLRTRICADSSTPYAFSAASAAGDAADGECAATLEKHCRSVPTVMRCRTSFTGSTSGTVNAGAGAKPVMCDGCVAANTVTASADRITVKGNIIVHLLALEEDGTYTCSRSAVPFEEEIPADGARDGDISSAWGRAASVGISRTDAGLCADIEYDIDAEWCRPGKVILCDDAYSTEYKTELGRTDAEVISMLCCAAGSVGVSGEIAKSKAGEPQAYVVDTAAVPRIEKAEFSGGRAVFSGAADVKVYIAHSGEVDCEDVSLPFKFEAALSGDAEHADSIPSGECVWSAHAEVTDIRARVDGGKVTVSADLFVSAEAARKTHFEPVCEAVIGDRRPDGGECCIRVCYPRGGESVWEVAKRCGASLSEVERINKVTGDSLCDGSPLIVK